MQRLSSKLILSEAILVAFETSYTKTLDMAPFSYLLRVHAIVGGVKFFEGRASKDTMYFINFSLSIHKGMFGVCCKRRF